MENSLYIGLSKQMVMRTNMNIIANNVANMNTTGFRGQNLMFEEYIADPRGGDDELSFVYDRGQYQKTDPGPVRQTGNPLDIALTGPGFIGIEGPGEAPAYTRAGEFQLDPLGNLVTPDGYPVQGENGTINIPADSTKIKINKHSIVSNQNNELGTIKIVEFDNIQDLEALGGNLYTTTAQANAAENTTVMQGALEGSNVNSVLEMTRMIDTLRGYQSINKLMTDENDRLRGAIQKLTKTG